MVYKDPFTTLASFSSIVENTSRKESKIAFSGAIMPHRWKEM
jgi:hypothetical protein